MKLMRRNEKTLTWICPMIFRKCKVKRKRLLFAIVAAWSCPTTTRSTTPAIAITGCDGAGAFYNIFKWWQSATSTTSTATTTTQTILLYGGKLRWWWWTTTSVASFQSSVCHGCCWGWTNTVDVAHNSGRLGIVKTRHCCWCGIYYYRGCQRWRWWHWW